MANEATHSSLVTAGTRIAATLSSAISGTMDRQLFDPINLGDFAIMREYTPGGTGTKSSRLPAPVAFTDATNETTGGGSNSPYTPVSFTCTPTRKYAKYQATGLAALTDPVTSDPQDPRFPQLVADICRLLVGGVILTLTDVIAALFTSVTTTKGTTLQPLTVDDIYDGWFALNLAKVPISAAAPAFAVLAPIQMNHLIGDLRGESGPLAFQDATAQMLQAHGPGIVGRWLNIIFAQSDSCPLSDTSTNANGAMFARDAFAYSFMPVRANIGQIPASNLIVASEYFWLAMSRDEDNDMTTYFGNIYLGAAIAGENSRAVRMRSSAT